MKSYKLRKQSGAIETIQAKDFVHAQRIAYGRRGTLSDPVLDIILDEESESARLQAIALYKSLR